MTYRFGVPLALLAVLLGAVVPVAAEPPRLGSEANCEILPRGQCERWLARYDGGATVPDSDRAEAVVASHDGTVVYVTGRSPGEGTNWDFATVAYDTQSGTQVWAARYDGPASGADLAADLALSPDGDQLYVTGPSAGAGTGNDYATVAYDAATGEQLWVARYSGAGNDDVAVGVAVSLDGSRVYTGGYSSAGVAQAPAPPAANYDFATVAYDTDTGEQLWVTRYDGPAKFWDVAAGIGVAAVEVDGQAREQVIVAGRSNGESAANNHADLAVVAYDGESGTELWVARHDSGDRDVAYDVAVAPDGSGVYVTGESGGTTDYLTVAYDPATGAERWIARYRGPGGSDRALGVAVDPAGAKVYVTGYSVNASGVIVDRAATTVAYAAGSGEELWVARHDLPGGTAAADVAVSPDGERVYIAGLRGGLVFFSFVKYSGFLVVAYEADGGDEVWAGNHSGRYEGFVEEDNAQAVTVGPDGSVYAAGGGVTYVTTAYDP